MPHMTKVIAEQTARHFDQPFEVVQVRQMDLLESLEEAVWMGETLAINGQLPAKYVLFKRLREAGIKVVLSGEGADEALLGYPHFKQDLGALLEVSPPWLSLLGGRMA